MTPEEDRGPVTDADLDSLLDWLEGRSNGGRYLTRGEAASAIRALREQLERAQADARRYRHLVATADVGYAKFEGFCYLKCYFVGVVAKPGVGWTVTKEVIDQHIDAAMENT